MYLKKITSFLLFSSKITFFEISSFKVYPHISSYAKLYSPKGSSFFTRANLISSFSINQSDNWSILYDYNTKTQFDPYLARIDDMGNETNIYSPMATNGHYQMTEADKTW